MTKVSKKSQTKQSCKTGVKCSICGDYGYYITEVCCENITDGACCNFPNQIQNKCKCN